ncbi:hypothetical protein QCA50_006689 [Cerrena zonata]|uniref:Uncharacterized protein n=1 Tax=Cerrena zonata TaxID=2478898 RepID=A0AAW0GE49_9APHY
MSAQVVVINTAKKAPQYPFLSQPPPQKKRPTAPLPSPPQESTQSACPPAFGRRRSATTSTITAWVAEVIPGSPAPYSPRRSPSAFSRRPSISRSIGRRPSITSVRVSSASFLTFSETPTTASRIAITPSVKEFSSVDLTLVGYTSVFVRLPQTPMSAGPARRSPIHAHPMPSSPVKGNGKSLKSFRSLTSLKAGRRARSRSNAPPPTPPLPKNMAVLAAMEAKKAHAAASQAVAKNKKSKYAKYRPPPLATELALAQFMDGGKIDDHVTRYAQTQAKAAGAVKVDGQLVGVGDVWRDGEGGIWRDQDEEWEYAHLLGGDEDFCMGEVQWVEFSSDAGKDTGIIEERRESTSTQDSDLSMRFAMQTDDNSQDDLAAFGGDVASTVRIKPGMSVLAIPSRSRRTAKHLRKPEFLLNAFPVPLSPPGLPRTPSSPRFASGAGRAVMPKSKARRRPAPLKLTPPSPAFKCPTNPDDTEDVRKDFLLDSFAPRPPRRLQAPARAQKLEDITTVTNHAAVAQKSTGLQLKGFFRAIGGKKTTVTQS